MVGGHSEPVALHTHRKSLSNKRCGSEAEQQSQSGCCWIAASMNTYLPTSNRMFEPWECADRFVAFSEHASH